MKVLKTAIFMFLLIFAGIQASAQTAITQKEAQKLATSIDSLAQAGQWEKIENQYFDGITLGERAAKDFGLTGDDKKEFVEGVSIGLKKTGLFTTLAKQALTFDLLRVRPAKEGYSIIFRSDIATGGFNYFDFLVIKNKKGELKIADLYTYTMADYLSSVMSAMLVVNFPDGGAGGMNDEAEKTIKLLKGMTKARNDGDYAKVLADYSKLSAVNKKQKMFLGMRLIAAQQTNMEEYKKAVDDYYAAYPNEPGVNLMLIDRYFMDEDYTKALGAVNRVDSFVGGDVYLELYRGNIYTYLNEYGKAETSLKKFLDAFPKEESAYSTYVSLLIVAEKYALAVETMKKWEKETGANPMAGINYDDYPDFKASAEFKNYIKTRK